MSEEIELNPLMTTVTLPHLSITFGEQRLKVYPFSQTLPKFAIICQPAKESNLGQTEAFTTLSLDFLLCFHNESSQFSSPCAKDPSIHSANYSAKS